MIRKISEIGNVYSNLTVTGVSTKPFGGVFVKCACGTEKECRIQDLRSGRTKSCGCLFIGKPRIYHGKSRTPEFKKTYNAWSDIRQRITNPKNRNFKNYGGRGITMCDRWRRFDFFLEDMGIVPVGFSIERKDTNGNYNKENCTWIPRELQAMNKRNTIHVTLLGEKLAGKTACRKVGIKYSRFFRSVRIHGVDPQEAFDSLVQFE